MLEKKKINKKTIPVAKEGTVVDAIAVVSLCGFLRRSWESPEYEKSTQFSTLKKREDKINKYNVYNVYKYNVIKHFIFNKLLFKQGF